MLLEDPSLNLKEIFVGGGALAGAFDEASVAGGDEEEAEEEEEVGFVELVPDPNLSFKTGRGGAMAGWESPSLGCPEEAEGDEEEEDEEMEDESTAEEEEGADEVEEEEDCALLIVNFSFIDAGAGGTVDVGSVVAVFASCFPSMSEDSSQSESSSREACTLAPPIFGVCRRENEFSSSI